MNHIEPPSKVTQEIGRLRAEELACAKRGDMAGALNVAIVRAAAMKKHFREEAQRIARIVPYHGTDDKGD